jgi:dihydroflavonol-4-reductase
MKALVTGATGFVGRRLAKRLLNEGVEVYALSRDHRERLPKEVRPVVGDILSPDLLAASGLRVDRVYHLAALITFDPRRRDELLRVNGEGTANVLGAARRCGAESTVVVSSACTIGLSRNRNVSLDEDSPFPDQLARANPYLESKLVCEQVASASSSSQKVVIVNPTTIYGRGDYTLNSGTLVLKVARAKVLPVPPGGSNVVDVDDVVEGILAAGEKGRSGRRYILGGANLTFAEIFATVARIVNARPALVPLPHLLREPMAMAAKLAGCLSRDRFVTSQIVRDLFVFKYYSSFRAGQELNWSATRTFDQSIEAAWDFYAEQGFVKKTAVTNEK